MKHIIQLGVKLLSCLLFTALTIYPVLAESDCDLIINGDFSNGHHEWIAAVKNDLGARGSATFVNKYASFKIDDVGEKKSSISLEQRGIHIQKGESYQIRFKAKAETARPITVSVSDIGGNYPTLSKSGKDFNLTTEWEVYKYSFNADTTDFTTRIIFMLGAQIGDVSIDEVSMKKVNCENCLPKDTACNDNDACTINDKEDGNCNCAGELTSNNQIINSYFSGHFYDAWKRTIKTEDGAVAELVHNEGAARFEIEKAGIKNWNIALEQRSLSIEANQQYKISFKAKASEARNINVKISDVGGTFATYFSQDLALTDNFETYTFNYEAPFTDDEVRIVFNMGLETPDVTIDDVFFEAYICEPCEQYGLACDDGNACTINDKYDASCNCVSYSEKDQYINNGNFSNQFAGWMNTIYEDSGTAATANFEDKMAYFKIEKDGTKNWHISLEQRGIPFVEGETYAINFRAKAAMDRNINLKISDFPEANLTYFNQDLALTEKWQAYNYLFTPETTDNFTRIIFNMGIDELNSEPNEIFIDDVSITNIACSQYSPVHPQDSLVLLQFYAQSCAVDCDLDWTLSRPVNTWEGVEIENERVVALKLAAKNLSGSLTFLDLPALTELDLSYNNFKETLADFSNLTELKNMDIRKNQFGFETIKANLDSNSNLPEFLYSPQYVGEEETYILKEGSYKYLMNDLFQETENLSFQWALNDEFITNASTQNYNIQNMQVEDIGMYTLHITNQNLIPGFEIISKPNYVFINGYDIKGQQIYNNQIMVLFDSEEERDYYTKLFIDTNDDAKVAFACDCNRLLYLWEFKSSEQAAKVLLDIDKARELLSKKAEVEGEPNSFIELDQGQNNLSIWQWESINTATQNEEVIVYILDSGLDKVNLENTQFLMDSAPLTGCDEKDTAGYGFVTNQSKISIQYQDSVGHGTYGYAAITQGMDHIQNLKVVPVKIFDKHGKGSLFHFTCGLFHSIDNKADIINLSAGYNGVESSILEKTLQLAQQKGIFITTAAGNDSLNIDIYPQFPAYFAGKFYQKERLDALGNMVLDSEDLPVFDLVPYDNIISVAALNGANELAEFSNYGEQSVTISAYGENLMANGLKGKNTIYSGTSMATFYATRELATEIAKDKNRSTQQIWQDFEKNYLVINKSTVGKTITGKQIKATLKQIANKKSTFSKMNEPLRVFPNPSNGKISVEFDCKYNNNNNAIEIKIFNILGMKVFTQKVKCAEQIQLDINKFGKGTYFIETDNSGKQFFGKAIVN